MTPEEPFYSSREFEGVPYGTFISTKSQIEADYLAWEFSTFKQLQ